MCIQKRIDNFNLFASEVQDAWLCNSDVKSSERCIVVVSDSMYYTSMRYIADRNIYRIKEKRGKGCKDTDIKDQSS